MSTININTKHKMSAENLRKKIDELMLSINSELAFNYEWESQTEFIFWKKGAKGSIVIDDSNFQLALTLGMMYRALKSPIESKIRSVIEEKIS